MPHTTALPRSTPRVPPPARARTGDADTIAAIVDAAML